MKWIMIQDWDQAIAHSKYAFQLIDTAFHDKHVLVSKIKYLAKAYSIEINEIELLKNIKHRLF